MLPRENRLLSDFDFRRIRREGRRFGGSFFSLFVLETGPGPVRFGFIVGSRVSRLATQRNRIKRILRAEAAALLPRLKPGVWAGFWVREAAREANAKILRQSVHDMLQKAKVLL